MTPRQKFDTSLVPERPDLSFEQNLWQQGVALIAGVDEAGRGALAGPVAAGAVILSGEMSGLDEKLYGVKDSKIMSAAERTYWAVQIKAIAISWGVGFASSREIDRIGIVPATCLAVTRALNTLSVSVAHILVDYLTLPDIKITQTALIKGDARSLSIASASILAKTARDVQLIKMAGEYPGYHFAANKGYGTAAHRKAISELGPFEQHRVSFSPVKEYFSLFPPQTLTKD